MKKIKFCDVCGEILKPIKLETSEVVGICEQGHIDSSFNLEFSQELKMVEKGEGVINEEEETLGFPHTCKKCGHEECDVTDLGAFYGDESNIYLYKCRKCKYTERQADGSGNK